MKRINIQIIGFGLILLSTFSACEKGYDKPFYYPVFGEVTFNDKKVEVHDKWNFEILEDDYAKDEVCAYYRGLEIEGSDGTSFRTLSEGYSVDKLTVFYCTSEREISSLYLRKYAVFKELDWENPEQFKVLGNGFAKGEKFAYWGDANIIHDADALSFKSLGGSFASDKNYGFFEKQKIPNSIGKSFHFLRHVYAADTESVFYESNKINGAELKTFVILSHDVAKDSKKVYNKERLVEGIHAPSFKYFTNSNFAADKYHVYWNTEAITEADRSTFIVKTGSRFAKDKENYFERAKLIKPEDYIYAIAKKEFEHKEGNDNDDFKKK